jgi:hypothetical protein
MIHTKKILFSFLITCSLTGCAQGKYGIKKIDAFWKEQVPGNIPVDANGESLYTGPDTLHTVYIETNGQKIEWDKAWKNGKAYSITTTLITTFPVETGIEKATGKKNRISPAKGNQLWVLHLMPIMPKTEVPGYIKTRQMVIRGKYGSKTITQIVKKETELSTLPSV